MAQSNSDMVNSLGDGSFAKSGSMMVIRFETTLTDDEIRFIFQQCDRELETANSRYKVTDSPFFFAFPEWDNDSRDLWEIPEARAFAKRLSDLGLMGILNFKEAFDSSTVPVAGRIALYCILTGQRIYDSSNDKEQSAFRAMIYAGFQKLNEFIGKS